MKKFLYVVAVVAACIMLSSCGGCKKVSAGYVGVKVDLLGSNKGVQEEVVGVGRHWIGLNEELYLFPTFQQNVTWTQNRTRGSENDDSFTIQTSEGLAITADVTMNYIIDTTMISELFQKHRKGIEEITNVFVRNQVADALNVAASTRTAENIYGVGKQDYLLEVTEAVKSRLAPSGILVDKIMFEGSLVLPPEIEASIKAKAGASELAEQLKLELEQTQAEVAKSVAKAEGDKRVAELQAEANRIISASLTEQVLRNKELEIMDKKWSGNMPLVVGESASPMLSITGY